MSNSRVALALILTGTWTTPSGADELPEYEADDTVVVSAAKLPTPLDELAASITILDRDQLRLTPARTVPEILSSGAGLHTYDFSGTGMEASTESRGFAAQRETSHLRFLLDGLPFMDFVDDNALWDLFDLDQLERIEVMRSASSGIHGNTAFTGVVNLVPFVPRERFSLHGRVGGGSFGRFETTQTAGFRSDAWSGSLSGRWRNVDGWRDHSKWSGGSLYGSARIPLGQDRAASMARVGVVAATSDAERPGPLPRPVLDADPTTAATPLDENDVSRIHAIAAWESSADARHPYRVSVQASHETVDLVETVLDTQFEERRSTTVGAQLSWRLAIVDEDPVSTSVLFGVEASTGGMETSFSAVDGDGAVGAGLASGDVRRSEVSEFLRLEIGVSDQLTIAAGVRRDDLWSDLDPSADDPSGVDARDREMNAWSPSASVNYRWRGDDGTSSINAFVQAGRSFKTPTLTQLYEIRPLDLDGPGPMPPIRLSSADLDPQFADQVEVGIRGSLSRRFEWEATIYGMTTEDEIGFDLSTFSFANIGETTHQGFEASIALEPVDGLRVHAGHTLTRAEFDEAFAELDAEVVGKQINNVPKYMTRAGVDYAFRSVVRVGARVLDVREQWIDERNTERLDDYLTVDAYGEIGVGDQSIYVKALNVFDEIYETSGYVGVDAMGAPLPLFFPAPERRFEGGVRIRWR